MLYCLNPDCPSPENPESNVHCQHCGTKLALRDRFKALRPLGKGGFGTTYLAKDLDNRAKPCVIKRFSYRGTNPQATAKAKQLFEQEAERLDHLTHPQIPRLLAYFQEDTHLYLVQEFVAGQTLQAELAQTGLFSETKIREVLGGLLPILQFVHSRSVIHRDIKPDNIMRRESGELVLIDFGVAKLLEQSNAVKTGTTIGTPGFAAPEQTYGKVTPASDLFALGATCFELLTQALSTAQMPAIGYDWVDQWRSHVKQTLSNELAHVLGRLIEPDRLKRYSSAADVLRDLNANHSSPDRTSPNRTSPDRASLNRASTPAASLTQAPPHQAVASGRPTVAPASNASETVLSAKPIAAVSSVAIPQERLGASYGSPDSTSGNTSRVRSLTFQSLFWFQYGTISLICQFLGFGIGMFLGAFYAARFDQSVIQDASGGINLVRNMYWALAGFVVGTGQWIVLRRYAAKSLLWIPMIGISYWLIGFHQVSYGAVSLQGSILVGLLVGVLQWLAIRTNSTQSLWRIPWTMLVVVILFNELATGQLPKFFIWGSILSFLDGLFLTWMLKRKTL